MAGFDLPGATIDATDIMLNVGVGGVGLGAPSPFAFGNPLDSPIVQPGSDPFKLLSAGFGNLNPATTPGGSVNPVATATGTDQPTPSQGGSTTPGQSAPQASAVPGSIANYFVRGVIIVLGFIFVAVGLAMFRSNETIAAVVKGATS